MTYTKVNSAIHPSGVGKASTTNPQVDPELEVGGQGRAPKARAESRRRRREGEWGMGRGCPLPPAKGVWGVGSAPSPENFFYILRSKMAYFRDSVLNFVFFCITITV